MDEDKALTDAELLMQSIDELNALCRYDEREDMQLMWMFQPLGWDGTGANAVTTGDLYVTLVSKGFNDALIWIDENRDMIHCVSRAIYELYEHYGIDHEAEWDRAENLWLVPGDG